MVYKSNYSVLTFPFLPSWQCSHENVSDFCTSFFFKKTLLLLHVQSCPKRVGEPHCQKANTLLYCMDRNATCEARMVNLALVKLLMDHYAPF